MFDAFDPMDVYGQEADEGLYAPTRCAPDEILTTHFGSVSNRAVPIKLCTTQEQANELKAGDGEYRFMRKLNQVTNTDMYKYLRMGVSSQSVMAFKALGYMTPESLQESPEVSALLPDILVREDRPYPLEFIDECERDGISALDCQTTLRRGITTSHLSGKLNTAELIGMFNVYVNREGVTIPVNGQKGIVDYFVDGTIPLEIRGNGALIPDNIVAVVRHFLKHDEEYLKELNSNLPVFRKFISKVKTGKERAVGDLRDLLDTYGEKVLDLYDPYLCSTKVTDDDGSSHKMGYELTSYIETIVTEELGQYRLYRMTVKKGCIQFYDRLIPLRDFKLMFEAGISVAEVRQFVMIEKMTPDAVVTAKNDGIISPFLNGSL